MPKGACPGPHLAVLALAVAVTAVTVVTVTAVTVTVVTVRVPPGPEGPEEGSQARLRPPPGAGQGGDPREGPGVRPGPPPQETLGHLGALRLHGQVQGAAPTAGLLGDPRLKIWTPNSPKY